MKINYKAPKGFILDLSPLMHTVDTERELSPLAWQYMIEQDLINKLGLDVQTQTELYPSLCNQIRLIYRLQERYLFSVVNCVPGPLVLYLRGFEVQANVYGDDLYLVLGDDA